MYSMLRAEYHTYHCDFNRLITLKAAREHEDCAEREESKKGASKGVAVVVLVLLKGRTSSLL